MTIENSIPVESVIGFPVTAMTFDQQMTTLMKWAKSQISRVVCVANVHMLMEASCDPALASVLYGADLVTPDGMPLVWMLRFMGRYSQDRVCGMDVMTTLCELAPLQDVSVFFLGSTPEILDSMRSRLNRDFPDLKIAGMEALPFRPMTAEEDAALMRQIRESGAGIVFVSLGCPKQELWMAQHRSQISAVMVGVGGVFPVYAGHHKRAPLFVRESGLEWLYRLVQEPRRLWSRYARTIPPFLWLAFKQLLILQGRVQPSSRN
jgi:N-acetylglucosaminyldiphosphoundecaprenol N-acetyl-beta-D-mannosaminyltransferase